MSIARKIGNLGTALDSAALSTFLSKGTTDGEFDTIAWGDVTGKPSYIDSSQATQLFDSAYVQLRQSTVSSGGLDSAAVTSLIDSNYVAARATAASSSGFVMYNYNATSGQTAFQDSDTAGNVLSYTADGILVYYNGLLLADEDYTATDGAAVTLTEGADSGAQITIGKWNLTGSGSSGGSSATWYGDRGVIGGGADNSASRETAMEYISIATPSNTTSFGNLTTGRFRLGSVSGDGYGVFAGGLGSSDVNVMDYITVATIANATDFGDLTTAQKDLSGCSNGTRGVFAGGYIGTREGMEYITIASPSNAADYADLSVGRFGAGSASDATYGVWSNGNEYGGTYSNIIDYITIATTSNATDFGDSTDSVQYRCGGSDDTRGVFGGGSKVGGAVNVIDYITIATPSNATDFGDLIVGVYGYGSAAVDGTYWVNHGGFTGQNRTNVMSYVTIQTTSNATDFGDLSKDLNGTTAVSGASS